MQQPSIDPQNQIMQQPPPQQMVLCPVRLVYDTQILVRPDDSIQPYQTIYINNQKIPPWLVNNQQPGLMYVQRLLPNNMMPSVQYNTVQHQLYSQNVNLQPTPNTMLLQNQITQLQLPNFMPCNMVQNVTASGSNIQNIPTEKTQTLVNPRQMPTQILNNPNTLHLGGQSMQTSIQNTINVQKQGDLQKARADVHGNWLVRQDNIQKPQDIQRMNITNSSMQNDASIQYIPYNFNNPYIPKTQINLNSQLKRKSPNQDDSKQKVLRVQDLQSETNKQFQGSNVPTHFKTQSLNETKVALPINHRLGDSITTHPPKIQIKPYINTNPNHINPIKDYCKIQPIKKVEKGNNGSYEETKVPNTIAVKMTIPNPIDDARSSLVNNLNNVNTNKFNFNNAARVPPQQDQSKLNTEDVKIAKENNELLTNAKKITEKHNVLLESEKRINNEAIDAPKVNGPNTNEMKIVEGNAPLKIENVSTKANVKNNNKVKQNLYTADAEINDLLEAKRKMMHYHLRKRKKAKNNDNNNAKRKTQDKNEKDIDKEKGTQDEATQTDVSVKKETIDFSASDIKRGNILTHVVEGIIIQEADFAFPIREPLKEKDIQTNKQNASKKATSKELDSKLKISHALNKDGNTEGKESDSVKDRNGLACLPGNPFLHLKRADVKSWTANQLATHLAKFGWLETALVLREHEVDGESLFLANSQQLADIGVTETHVAVISEYIL